MDWPALSAGGEARGWGKARVGWGLRGRGALCGVGCFGLAFFSAKQAYSLLRLKAAASSASPRRSAHTSRQIAKLLPWGELQILQEPGSPTL